MRVPTPLTGCRVDRTAFDYQVRLSLSTLKPDADYRVDAELSIETPFLLRDPDGQWHELGPGTGASLAPVLDLFGQIISSVEIRDKGALHLTFGNGAELHVGPNHHYESWHLTGTGVDPITVGPGGETDWQSAPPPEPRPNG
ncbi:DUF6188 family protein [Micromonospora echinaurantiaca]|uniref:DUF6188 family protein n=1 Tax=Micromonospora echinaurantiaca TaxID=47857 RepID=UPI0037BC44D9